MQYKLTKGPLLNNDGNLIEAGYSTNLIRKYDRNQIKASRMRIKEWDYYYIGNQSKGIALYLLPKLMPKALISPFVSAHSDNGGITLVKLSSLLKGWRFEIKSYVGYERCVVTAGGVSMQEVSQKTMESKLVKGLFFAGEILDLDGDTGGYNLQIAFSTAALAANSITV